MDVKESPNELTASEIKANELPMMPPKSFTIPSAKLIASPNTAARVACRYSGLGDAESFVNVDLSIQMNLGPMSLRFMISRKQFQPLHSTF